MRTLSNGSHGSDVTFLQCLLNDRLGASAVPENGQFGAETLREVMAFQGRQSGLVVDGVVGPLTWARFGPIRSRLHPVHLRAQPNDHTCWSAAAAMMRDGRMVGHGRAALADDGGLDMPIDNIDTFLRGLHWRMVNRVTRPPATSVITWLGRSPLWVAYEGGNFAHAVVYSGYYTTGSGSNATTVFRVHDPWPPGRGTVYGTSYRGGTAVGWSTRRPVNAMIAYAASP
jgi:Putative peptidoglycan binding domain/Papain-like cysteine protease AvrRpt2